MILGSRCLPFALAVLVSTSALVAKTPNLVELESNRDARSAPIVIVGVIAKDERVGPLVPSQKDPRQKRQIRRIRVRVENVLKGSLDQKVITAYYLGVYLGHHGIYNGSRPLGFWRPPSRRILFIRPDGDVLRIACDVFDCTRPVASGSHLGYVADPSKPIDYALVDIQLTRGQGEINDLKFGGNIAASLPGTSLDGYVIEKLQRLASTESILVKAPACEMLWIYAQEPRYGPRHITDEAAGNEALKSAQCTCKVSPDGNVACK